MNGLLGSLFKRSFVTTVVLAASLVGAPVVSASQGFPSCGVTDGPKNLVLLFWGYGAIENCLAYRQMLGWSLRDTTNQSNAWYGLVNSHSPRIHLQCAFINDHAGVVSLA